MTKTWNKWSLHLAPGYMFLHGLDKVEANAVTGWRVAPKVTLFTEYNYTAKEESGETHDLVPGIIWKPIKGICIKGGVICNLNSTVKFKGDYNYVFNVSYKF